MQVPPLTLRIEKGSPLTAVEGDNNLKILRDFANALAALYGVSFKNDGTLIDLSITTGKIKDRQITQAKLDFFANFFATASGTNAYSATISPTTGFTLGDGAATSFIGFIKFMNANTTVATLNINGFGATPLKKFVTEDLEAGDIAAGAIHPIFFDGTNLQIPTILRTVSAVPVYAQNSTPGATVDITFIKPSSKKWVDFELDLIGDFNNNGGGGNVKFDFSYQTAPEAGNAPATGGSVGLGNGGQTIVSAGTADTTDNNFVGHWMYRGAMTANLAGTDSVVLRATRTLTAGMTQLTGFLMGRAHYQ